jgi:hypothetical protein
MSMVRSIILAAMAAAAWGQAPAGLFDKPPAGVDEALRARITQFYGYHVNREFRKAEDMVAADTKEFFYSNNKPAYLSFEIKEIKYSENFTKAKAILICEQYVMMMGFADKPMKIPTPSTWKFENGNWYWYVDMESLRDSPFGKMTPGATPASAPVPSVIPSSVDFVLNKVQTDRQSVALKPGGSAEVAIANTAPGIMMLSVSPGAPGVAAELSKPNLNAGERGVLTLKAGQNARSGQVIIMIQPTGESIPIQVNVEQVAMAAARVDPPPAPPVRNQVKLDRQTVSLKRGSSAQVVIDNPGQQTLTLSLAPLPKGLTAQLSRKALNAGEKSVLTIKASKLAKSAPVTVVVQPGGESLAISVELK